MKNVDAQRKNQIQNLVFKIDDYIQIEKSNNASYLKNKENSVSLLNSDLLRMREVVEEDINYDSYKVFSEGEKLQAIGSMAKEIDGSGYAVKTNKKKYRLDKRLESLRRELGRKA